MSLSSSFSEPITRITNSGMIDRDGYNSNEIANELKSRGPQGWHDVRMAFSPDDVPVTADSDKDAQYEAVAMTENEVAPEVMSFVRDVENYFNEQARNEGYIGSEEKIQFRTIFVPEDKFAEISLKERGSISPNIRISTNTVYIPYPSNFERGRKLYMYESIFHEFRHRIGRHILDFKIIPSDDDEEYSWLLNQRLGMDYITAVPRGGGSAWEEIFVVGFESENIQNLQNVELQNLLSNRKEIMQELGIDPRYITTWIDDINGERGYSEYRSYNDAYLVLKTMIPNILELMTAVRRGETGSRHKLAQTVLKEFGKEGLAGLAYSTGESKMELAYLLYGIAMGRRGKRVSTKQENSEIIKDNLKVILNRHDGARDLSSRFGI